MSRLCKELPVAYEAQRSQRLPFPQATCFPFKKKRDPPQDEINTLVKCISKVLVFFLMSISIYNR